MSSRRLIRNARLLIGMCALVALAIIAASGSARAAIDGGAAGSAWSAATPAAGVDAGAVTIDAGLAPIDAGAPVDAPPRDAAPVDAAPRDAAPVDAAPRDAAPAAAAPVRPAAAAPGTTSTTATPTLAATTTANTLFAIKVIGGLVVLIVLAYLGGHRRVVRFQERLGVTSVITAGFPFVALGLIASHPAIGILSGDVLTRLRPILHFGLGWLGFIIGAQLDIRVLDRVPKGTAYLILVEALGPFAITAAACGALMLSFGLSWTDPAVWRNLVLLGTAAAMTAPRRFRGFANRTWREGRGVDVLLAQLDEIVGVVGLLFITAYFRDPNASAWQLPDNTAWIFISLGLGVAIGVLIFAMVRVPSSNAEFLAVVLGAVAFAAGLAGYLQLSPIVVCFIAGVLVTNFPNDQRASMFRILNHLERPVHLLFLIIAGALWGVADWRGWLLVPLFVVGRVVGKFIGVTAARSTVGAQLPAGYADRRTLITPLSGLSIALVVSVDSLYHDVGVSWITTAVIGGAILSEFLVQLTPVAEEQAPRPIDELDPLAAAPRGPIDELDDASGPVYHDDDHAPSRKGPP